MDAEVGRRGRPVARVVGRDEPLEVAVDLGDVAVGVRARRRDAVARSIGRGAGEVVAFLDREHEERVGLGDPVVLQAGEEVTERLVVVLQLLDVARLAGSVGDVRVAGDAVEVMRVGDVGERHRDAVLLHLGDLAEGVLGEHPVEAGEAGLPKGSAIGSPFVSLTDGRPVVDRGVDVLGAEQPLKPS